MERFEKKGRKMNHAIMSVVLCLILFIPGSSGAQVTDRVVAVVNNEVITLYDLNKAVGNYMSRVGKTSEENREKILAETRTILLNRMIEDLLVQQQAKKSGTVIREEDAMNSILDMLARRKVKLEDFKQALVREGTSFEAYKEEVKSHLMKVRLAQREVRSKITVSDEEIGNYYSQHRDLYEGKESARLLQILIAVPPGADEETKQKLRAEAEDILKKLKSGEAFELMAARF